MHHVTINFISTEVKMYQNNYIFWIYHMSKC